jgi:hypothetical protein
MEGARIVVNGGVYHERIDLQDKNLQLIGHWCQDSNMTSPPVLIGDGTGPVVTIAGGQDANCVIDGFHITDSPDYGILCQDSSPTIMHCLITDNHTHCLITDNHTSGITCQNSTAVISQCTLVDNGPDPNGGGLCCWDSNVTVNNSILWDNQAQSIFVGAGPDPLITYSDVEHGWPGEVNLDADPLFTDEDHYHLHSEYGCWDPDSLDWVYHGQTSPCIDAGDPLCACTQEPLPNGERVNMGTYGQTGLASKSRE